MLILPHGAIKRLLDTGSVEVWTPADQGPPALNVQHVVRKRYYGQSITHAKARGQLVTAEAVIPREGRDQRRVFWRPDPVRDAVLQDLTYPEALAAGFRTRDDFYAWWRERYATGPLMTRIDCLVTTYEHVLTDAPHYLSTPIPGKQGDYTANRHHAIDDLETVDADEWARKADHDRELHAAQAKALWRARRRRKAA